MNDQLKALASLRKEIEGITIEKDLLEHKYKENPAYISYVTWSEVLMSLKVKEAELTKSIREHAVELSKATGYETRKFDKVEVKEFTVVSILDTKQAVQWAAQNAPSTLSLTKEFDKVAKSLELPFVKVEKEYRGQIASNLDDLLVE